VEKTSFAETIANAIDEQQNQAKPREHRCETCKFAERNAEPNDGDSQFECHRMPPRAQALIAATHSGPRPIGTIATFPPVGPNNWCGEWAPQMAVMS